MFEKTHSLATGEYEKISKYTPIVREQVEIQYCTSGEKDVTHERGDAADDIIGRGRRRGGAGGGRGGEGSLAELVEGLHTGRLRLRWHAPRHLDDFKGVLFPYAD